MTSQNGRRQVGERQATVSIDIAYAKDREPDLAPILTELENKLGARRKPYGPRFGAIDLVTCLEFVLSFVAVAALRQALESYFAGLIGAKRVEELGEKHRVLVVLQ